MHSRAEDLFEFEERIGSGSFGDVYAGVDRRSGEHVAVKMEACVPKAPKLLLEAQVYKCLAGRHGFAQLRHCSMEPRRNVLVVSLLGSSLDRLFRHCGQRFSFKTVAMLADQLIQRLEVIHDLGWVHRDINPENCLMGVGEDAGLVHLIDFGLAKRFLSSATGRHIEPGQRKAIRGTVRFASLSACRAMEQSRRDDLEALGFVLVYFLRGGHLPWQGQRAFTRRVQLQTIVESKCHTSFQDLCAGIDGSEVLEEYLRYCRGLEFKDRPDYGYLRQLFAEALAARELSYDCGYDWAQPQEPVRPLGQPDA